MSRIEEEGRTSTGIGDRLSHRVGGRAFQEAADYVRLFKPV
jgi:hypothetical protein